MDSFKVDGILCEVHEPLCVSHTGSKPYCYDGEIIVEKDETYTVVVCYKGHMLSLLFEKDDSEESIRKHTALAVRQAVKRFKEKNVKPEKKIELSNEQILYCEGMVAGIELERSKEKKMEKEKMRCENCEWWEVSCNSTELGRELCMKNHKKCEDCVDSYRGYCRRFPPTRCEDKEGNWAHPPSVEGSDWCGEFKKKE